MAETAVYYNLLALGYLRLDEKALLDAAMIKAESYINEALKQYDSTSEQYSRAARYKSQISINRAQIAVKNSTLSKACDILKEDVTFCGQYASEYLPEAEGELSLVKYKACKFNDALSCAVLALNGFKYIGALNAITEARKILIAALAKLGNQRLAHELVRRFNSDPLGVTEVGFIEW
ncbi:hypothetical protein [Bifidobacterium bohemicum]|uniref:hypothetical protein n=1 Tax=Bifidobacterium bohemicum TaxID=638617 RepID=UPI0011773425|nr:hypothetical protein [Bifidobacterium bohemicum]